MTVKPPHLSVVVPFHNEASNVTFVLLELRAVLPDAEVIAVDDASTDGTWKQVRAAEGSGSVAGR